MTYQTNSPSHSTNCDSDKDPSFIDLLGYLEVIVKRLKMILAIMAFTAILSITISLLLPNKFTSTALILPPQQDSSGLMGMLMGGANGIGGMAADLLGTGSSVDMYVSVLNCDAISDKIIDRFNLMKVYGEEYRQDTYNDLRRNVDISCGKKDGIITIAVTDRDPKRAANIANAYVDELSKLLGSLNVTSASNNKSFLNEQLANAKVNLAKAEDSIRLFQSKNKVIDVTEQAKGTVGGIADLEGQLAAEEVKLDGLKRVFTDNSQEVINQQSIIKGLRAQIAKFEGSRTGDAFIGVGSAPKLGQQYLRLLREFKIQETLVELLTKQREVANLSEAKDVPDIQIIQQARVPDKKSKPKRGLIVLASTFASGFMAVCLVFIVEAVTRLSESERFRLRRILALIHCNISKG